MKSIPLLPIAGMMSLLMTSFPMSAQNVPSGPAFYGDPPDKNHPWAIHDRNRPQPPRVEPGTFSSQQEPGKPPSDAVILFDGTEKTLKNWLSDKNEGQPTDWIVKDGALQCVPGSGYIRTKEEWGDCQLHIEWAAPTDVKGDSQGRGNSGVFLSGAVEVQVLDNYNNPTYADGFAGSVYGVKPPDANVLRAPGEWQTYDIIYRRPIFKDGKEIHPGYLTVFVNGVLVQDHTPLEGGGGHMRRSKPREFPEKGPLKLQDHGNPVRFRNIWYRPLPPRVVEGGTDGFLSEEATQAKRAEIAAEIRESASQLEGRAQLMRYLESLIYEVEAQALKTSIDLAGKYQSELEKLSQQDAEARKGETEEYRNAVHYLVRHQIVPANFPPKEKIDALITKRGWDPKE